MQMRYGLFWDIMKHEVVIPHQCYGNDGLSQNVGMELPLCNA